MVIPPKTVRIGKRVTKGFSLRPSDEEKSEEDAKRKASIREGMKQAQGQRRGKQPLQSPYFGA